MKIGLASSITTLPEQQRKSVDPAATVTRGSA